MLPLQFYIWIEIINVYKLTLESDVLIRYQQFAQQCIGKSQIEEMRDLIRIWANRYQVVVSVIVCH